MYFLVGLPLDSEISDENIIVSLRAIYTKIELITVPSFSTCDLDTLFDVSSTIVNIEKMANTLFENFIKAMTEKNIPIEIDNKSFDYAVKSFKWQDMRFPDKTVGKICGSMKESIGNFTEAFSIRKGEYVRTKKSISDKIRDMDILANDYDFITEHYILIMNNREKDFIVLMHELYGDDEVYEVVLKDNENTLYKLISINSDPDEIKKTVSSRGFSYKQPISSELYYKKQAEREENKRKASYAEHNLELYLTANLDELFILLMHIKVLRVYVESVLLYGMGKYVFFIMQSHNPTRELKKIIMKYRFSKLINKEDFAKESFACVAIDGEIENEQLQ